MALAQHTRDEQFRCSPLVLLSATARFSRVEIDIGCGNGGFLARLAARQPEMHLVGVEVASGLAERAAARMIHEGIQNVTIINGKAEIYIDSLSNESVDAFHIYFPTPFPRSIGLSTCLITQRFWRDTYRVLRAGGIIRLLTDRKEYHDRMIRSLHLSQSRFLPISWPPVIAGQQPEQLVGTDWERRVLIEQGQIRRLCVRK